VSERRHGWRAAALAWSALVAGLMDYALYNYAFYLFGGGPTFVSASARRMAGRCLSGLATC
jgi:hypothetical protein